MPLVAIAAGTQPIGLDGKLNPQLVVPQLFEDFFPSWFAGVAFAAIAIGALVPAAIMSIAAANTFTRNIYKAWLRPNASIEQEAKVTPESYRRWMMSAYELTIPPEAIDPYVEARTRIRGSADYPRWLVAYVNSYQMIWREPVAGEIPLLIQPVLFLMGENDHVAPGRDMAPEALRSKMGQNVELARELAGKMPRGKVEVFDGVGHLIHLEAPQRFNESVLHFLNDGR